MTDSDSPLSPFTVGKHVQGICPGVLGHSNEAQKNKYKESISYENYKYKHKTRKNNKKI